MNHLKIITLIVVSLISNSILASPNWEVNPAQFAYNGEITAKVIIDGSMTNSGILGAFVGSQCRGVADASYFPPADHYVFTIMCYANEATGDNLTFKYYDPVADKTYDISNEVAFEPNMIEGSAMNPLEFSITTSQNHSITTVASPEEGGTVTGAGVYDHGQEVTLTATPNNGYTFINWTCNGHEVSANSEYKFIATQDSAFVANFEESSTPSWEVNPAEFAYNGEITAKVIIDGSMANSGILGAFVGSQCRGVADASYFPPADHYVFTIMCYGNETTGDNLTFKYYDTVADKTYDISNEVAFEPNMIEGSAMNPLEFSITTSQKYSITTVASPELGGTVTGAGEYNHGQEVTLTATPNNGYTFINWTCNGHEVSTDSEYKFVANQDRSFVANFDLTTNIGNDQVENLKIYPNPTSDILKIKINSSSIKPEYVIVSNALGQIQNKIKVSSQDELKIDLSSYINGIYLIELKYNNTSKVHKIIKQ